MQKKRKFQDQKESKIITSGPIDIETNQRGVFPELIELNDSSESDDTLPFDGISYLKKVRSEAKHRPGIKAVQAPPTMTVIHISKPTLSTKTTEAYSYIWEKEFLETFLALRISFNSLHTTSKLISLPEDKAEWYRLILKTLHPPTTSMINCIDHSMALELLKWNTGWLSSTSPQQQMMWIFFLLIKIDTVMTSDELSILRELCKKCLILRNSKTTLPLYIQFSIDMVISIVGNLFGQKDLLLNNFNI